MATVCGLTFMGAAGGAYMRFFEPGNFAVTEKVVPINRFKEPLRILHLSDFHASRSVSLRSIERAIDIALELDGDVAFLTGDYITRDLADTKEYSRILKKISAQMPVFASIGNHDGGGWSRKAGGYDDFSKVQQLLEDSGITFLFNARAECIIRDQTFSVVGLGDLWAGDLKPDKVLAKERLGDHPLFVLSHNPDSKSALLDYDWDLMCCGHTHGGQLVVPFLGWRPFLPVKDKTFPEGLRSWGNQHVHITRGVGNLHGMRFNCKPEISILNVT